MVDMNNTEQPQQVAYQATRGTNRRSRNTVFVILFVIAAAITVVALIAYFALVSYFDSGVAMGDAVAVVDIQGEIFFDRSKLHEIESHRKNDKVKAVVLFINSPGGGVAASQALHRAILDLRLEKPVVAFLASVAASGGYYAACAADSIIATEGTLTGSIGVIAAFLRTEELYHKIGLDVTVIKSGKYKDVGSPYREMTQTEKAYMGRLLDRVYDQFVTAVAETRDLPLERAYELAEGRLYTGDEAMEVGLVDRLGSYEDAVLMAAKMGGIEGEPRVVKKRRRRDLWERIWGETAAALAKNRAERVSLKYIIP
ncbi:MAG: signal peptide peptidase SppA [Candidatus Krumholzibacteria bacterium]|nr:signal peptide peptidase SppA [Candidatus Krumholzibacteria bacterium]